MLGAGAATVKYSHRAENRAPHRLTFAMSAETDTREPFDVVAVGAHPDDDVGSLVGVAYAEAFKARSPLLVADPTAFVRTPFG